MLSSKPKQSFIDKLERKNHLRTKDDCGTFTRKLKLEGSTNLTCYPKRKGEIISTCRDIRPNTKFSFTYKKKSLQDLRNSDKHGCLFISIARFDCYAVDFIFNKKRRENNIRS